MAKIDKNKLGVDASILAKARIEFIEENTPQIEAVSRYEIEGIENYLEVKKTDGNHRPFLVGESQVLHANIARYMTTSFSEERRKRDNRIMGEHLFEVPFGLYNYIAKSSIRGKLDYGRVSVVDKNRCLLLTEDAFVESRSRAKDINDFDFGINTHIANAQNITKLLELDLATTSFEDSVLSGKPELLVFKMQKREPVFTYPSAMYLKLAINGFSKFSNERQTVTRKNLDLMGKTAGMAVTAYSEYLKHNKKIVELEEKHPDVYQLLQTIRFYDSLTPAMFKGIQENKQIMDENGENHFRYIYGDPVYSPETPLDERLMFELTRAVPQGRLDPREITYAKNTILEILREERKLSTTLGQACESVVGCLNQVGKEEKINLSEFEYNEKLLDAITNNFQSEQYVSSLAYDFGIRYNALARNQENSAIKKEQTKKAKELDKKKKREAEAMEQERIENMRKELSKRVLKRYMDIYSRAVRAHSSDALIPTKSEQARISNLYADTKITTDITLGKRLEEKLERELLALKKMGPYIQTFSENMEKGIERMRELEQNPENLTIFNLISEILAEQDKISKTSQQKITPKLTAKVVAETIQDLDISELENYYAQCFPTGDGVEYSEAEELLMCMQEVANYKSQLLSYANLKRNKEGVLEALAELNSPENLDEYLRVYNEVVGLSKGKITTTEAGKVRGIDEIARAVEEEAHLIDNNPTLKDYEELNKRINGQTEYMKGFVRASQEMLETKVRYYDDISEYNKDREYMITGIKKAIEEIPKNLADRVKETEDYEDYGVTKEGDEYIIAGGKTGIEPLRTDEAGAKKYIEEQKAFREDSMKISNFVDVEEERSIIEDICNLCYPSEDMLNAETKRQLSETKNLKEAVKVYQSREKLINNLHSDMVKFLEIFKKQYSESVGGCCYMVQVYSCWNELFKQHSDRMAIRRENDLQIEEPYKSVILDAHRRTGDEVSERVIQDFKRYREELRNSMRDMVAHHTPRVAEATPLEDYLSKVVIKSGMFDNMPQAKMPQSFIGPTGVSAVVEQMRKLKGDKTDLFNALADSTYQEDYIERGAEYFGRNTNEIINYGLFVGDIIAENVEPAYKEIQKMELEKQKATLLASVRMWAVMDPRAKECVMNPGIMEKTMRSIASQKGVAGTELVSNYSFHYNGLRNQGKSQLVGETLNVYQYIADNLPIVREALEKGKPLDNEEEFKDSYLFWFDSLFDEQINRVSRRFNPLEKPDFPDYPS